MARRTLLLIASILTAALGTALIWLYVQGADTRAQQGARLVPAFFLTRDLDAGAAPAALTTKYVTEETAAGAVTSAAQVGEKRLVIAAKAGQILLQSMLGTAGQVKRFPNDGAVAVTITDANRVPADLAAGDTVDVFALTKGGAARRFLDNIIVRTIGLQGAAGTGTNTPAAGTAQPAGVPAQIVGLNVTQRQAQDLYDVVAGGGEIALYLHDPKTP